MDLGVDDTHFIINALIIRFVFVFYSSSFNFDNGYQLLKF
jgi:hypothetical protein